MKNFTALAETVAKNATPAQTESLARELMRNLLGEDAAPTITIETGPNAGASRTLAPPESTFVIGRGDEATWSILDEDLSRRHVEIRRTWDGTFVADLESQNGTSVDGKRIEQPVLLRDGMKIAIGSLVFVYADEAERHLKSSPKATVVREAPVVAPPSRPSAPLGWKMPFVIAALIAAAALAAFVYVLAS